MNIVSWVKDLFGTKNFETTPRSESPHSTTAETVNGAVHHRNREETNSNSSRPFISSVQLIQKLLSGRKYGVPKVTTQIFKRFCITSSVILPNKLFLLDITDYCCFYDVYYRFGSIVNISILCLLLKVHLLIAYVSCILIQSTGCF